jgi:hypothetical protein
MFFQNNRINLIYPINQKSACQGALLVSRGSFFQRGSSFFSVGFLEKAPRKKFLFLKSRLNGSLVFAPG